MKNELSELAKKAVKEYGLSDEQLTVNLGISEFINEKMMEALEATTIFDEAERRFLFYLFSQPPVKILVSNSMMLQSLSHAYNALIEMSEICKGFAKLLDKARNDFADQKEEEHEVD